MIPDHANPSRLPPRIGDPEPGPGAKRTCNRHHDCDAADRYVRERKGWLSADHCHDECCEDCFGQ